MMPPCSQCEMLKDGHCTAHTEAQKKLGRPVPPPPLGACVLPIVESYLPFIREGMSVLEVGCGSWDPIQFHCRRTGARYEGIDIQRAYYGKSVIATRVEGIQSLSFPDNSFDLVIGNQTMEHWAENGCSLRWGLYQCFRVCRPRGNVFMNVPIHFHGTRHFKLGELDKLRSLFAPFSRTVAFERWGYPSRPIPAYYPYPGYWPLRRKPPYVLDIRARKDLPLPTVRKNRGACSGRIAKLLNRPPSYKAYCVLRRLGLCG